MHRSFAPFALAFFCVACGDDKVVVAPPPADEQPNDVAFAGPTRNALPDQPQLPEEPVAMGPYEATVPCCDTSLTFEGAPAGGTVVVQGKLAPFAGAGLSMVHNGTAWEADVCIPMGLTMDFQYLVTPAGESVTVQIDSEYGFYEDEDGVTWNRLLLETCSSS